MKKFIVSFVVFLMSATATFAANEREQDRVKEAGTVLKEILNIPDDIPHDLLDKAECVIILPSVKKGAFGIGGSYGRGVMVCRSGAHYKGRWGAPALYALEGVSFGFQLGGQATDFVLLVMNQKGAQSLLYSKVKLGADASAAAGPKGRTAEGATDIVMSAEILSYSRARGLFAGVALDGTRLAIDNKSNQRVYGAGQTARAIFEGRAGNPTYLSKGFVQYNDDRKTASFNFLWWYHYRPGSDLYLVYNQGNDTHLALTSAEALSSTRVHSRSLALKLTYWLAR